MYKVSVNPYEIKLYGLFLLPFTGGGKPVYHPPWARWSDSQSADHLPNGSLVGRGVISDRASATPTIENAGRFWRYIRRSSIRKAVRLASCHMARIGTPQALRTCNYC